MKVFIFKSTFDTIDCTDSIKPSWQTLTLAQRERKRNENRFTEKDFFLPFLCISLLLLYNYSIVTKSILQLNCLVQRYVLIHQTKKILSFGQKYVRKNLFTVHCWFFHCHYSAINCAGEPSRQAFQILESSSNRRSKGDVLSQQVETISEGEFIFLGLNRTGHMSFLTGQDRTPKFARQVLPDWTESGLIFSNILPYK